MEKLNRAQKCSILGPQNLGSRGGGPGPRDHPGSAPEEKHQKVGHLSPWNQYKGVARDSKYSQMSPV